MSYLRTNQKLYGTKLDAFAIGPGLLNWIEASYGTVKRLGWFGGMVVGSINGNNSAFSESAAGVISAYYGNTFISDLIQTNAGFKVVPVMVNKRIGSNNADVVFPTTSITGSNFVFIVARASEASVPTFLTISAHFTYVGFIVSAPSRLYGA